MDAYTKYTIDDVIKTFGSLNDALNNLKNEDDQIFTPVYVQPYTSIPYDTDIGEHHNNLDKTYEADTTKYKPNTINVEFIKERLLRENELESENAQLKKQIKLLEEKLKTNCK